MKLFFAIFITLLAASNAAAELPFPVVSGGNLSLPFGMRFHELDQKKKIQGFGEPQCTQERCDWSFEDNDSNVFFTQYYNRGALSGFGLLYILTSEAGHLYREKLRTLKEGLGGWEITGPGDLLQSELNFRAVSRDLTVTAKYREGEYSTSVILDIRVK